MTGEKLRRGHVTREEAGSRERGGGRSHRGSLFGVPETLMGFCGDPMWDLGWRDPIRPPLGSYKRLWDLGAPQHRCPHGFWGRPHISPITAPHFPHCGPTAELCFNASYTVVANYTIQSVDDGMAP